MTDPPPGPTMDVYAPFDDEATGAPTGVKTEWTRTVTLAGRLRVRIEARSMERLMGPFGGGWRTKFGVLVGETRVVVQWWRWVISITAIDRP